MALRSTGLYIADTNNGRVVELQRNSVNFGSLPVATATPTTQTLTFTFDNGGTISAPAVLTQGATGLDFVDAGTGSCTTNGTSHSYNAGDTCTVDVRFTPKLPGIRYGAVTLSSGGATIATGYVYGTGTGPQVTFAPGTLGTIGSGFNNPQAVAVDAAGDVFVADPYNNAVKEIVAVNGVVSASSPVNTVGGGFSYPVGVAVDAAGNVFVADVGHSAVKEIVAVNGVVSSTSTVNTVGSGISQPISVAVDAAGNVFVADPYDFAVKEIVAVNGVVSASSPVNTVGGGFSAPYGVAVDGFGDVFVADINASAVKEIVAVNGVVSSSSTVITIGSDFIDPTDVAVDGFGNVFVADTNHSAVKEIVAVNGVVSSSSIVITIGSGFSVPYGVAVDGRGNIFVADTGHNLVKEIDFADAPSLSFASTTVGSTSSDSPKTVTITNNGNAPLTFEVPSTGLNPSISTGFTYGNSSTCAQLSTTSSAATLAAGASCTAVISFTPTASGSISGSLVTTDNALNATGPNYATQTVSLSGSALPSPVVTGISPSSGAAAGGTSVTITGTDLGSATAVHFGSNAATIVSNTSTQIVATSPAGSTGTVDVTVTTPYGTSAMSASDQFTYSAPNNYTAPSEPVGTAGTTQTAYINITTAGTTNATLGTAIQVLTQGVAGLDFAYVTGGTCATSTAYTVGQVCSVEYSFTPKFPGTRMGGIALYSNASTPVLLGGTYISGTGTGPESLFSSPIQATLGTGFNGAFDLALDGAGNLYVPNQGTQSIIKIAAGTNTQTTVATGGVYTSVAFDGLGNMYAANLANKTIVEFIGGTGTPVTIASGLTYPDLGMAVDAQGNVYEPDTGTNVIVKVAAGTHTVTRFGSGLSHPLGVSLDTSGNMYISDSNNNRIVEITADGATQTTVATIINPAKSAFDAAGNLYVAETNGSIGKLAAGTFNYSQLAGGYNAPFGLALTANGTLYMSDVATNVITTFDRTSSPTLSFASTNDGSSSAQQTVTLENDGNATLNFVIPGSGLTNPTTPHDFTFTTTGGTACPSLTSSASSEGALAAGATCTVPIAFTPVSPSNGALSESLVFTDTNLNAAAATQSITLTGTAELVTPTVTGVSPSSGATAGGAVVTITGTGFTGSSAVMFGSSAASSFTVVSATTLTAVSPAGSGTVDVTVTTGGGTSAVSPADHFTYVPPPTATQAIASKTLTQNHAATAFTPVTGSGGASPLSYSVSPTLPTGLSFAPSTGTIAGTPSAAHTATMYTVTVTDANGATATASFSLTVNSAVTATTAVPSTALTQNHAAATFSPVTVAGGTTPLTYSISPALPAGLSLNPATGSISGTPTAASAATTYTVTVTDANSATGTAALSLTVNAAVTATTAVASKVLTQNRAATAFTPVTVAGGTTPLTYSIAPALPAGLSLASATGVISGTPTAASAATTYTVTVTDANSATGTAALSLTVNAAVTATTAVSSKVLTQNHAATAFTPVTGSGGTTPLTYSISPALPAGLNLASATGTISGTPTGSVANLLRKREDGLNPSGADHVRVQVASF